MRFLDLLEREDPRGPRHEVPLRHGLDELLKRNFAERKFQVAQGQCAREHAQAHATGNLENRLTRQRLSATQEAHQADFSTATSHGERIEDRARSNNVEHGVNAARMDFAHPSGEPRFLDEYRACAERFQQGGA